MKLSTLRSKCDKVWYLAALTVWGEKCCACGKTAGQVHHYYPKGQYGHMRFNLENAIPICVGCHFSIHTKHDTGVIMAIRKNRGEDWFKKLSKEANQTPRSYRGVKWYKENIKLLQEIVDKGVDIQV